MLIFVDYEHASGNTKDYAQRVQAARTWITYRLEDLSGLPCHLVRYDRIDQDLLDRIEAQAIFISGNSIHPDEYGDEVAPIHEILRSTELPVFGFCGGFQLLAQALDAPVESLKPSPEQVEVDNTLVVNDTGTVFEAGYHPIDLSPDALGHPVLDGVADRSSFRHAHQLHVAQLPAGFDHLASTSATRNQMAAHPDRKIVGTQFHPEYWTDKHPAGRTMIGNFLDWGGVETR